MLCYVNRKSHSANRMVPYAGKRDCSSARNRVRHPSNSAVNVASNSSHVALSLHICCGLLLAYFSLQTCGMEQLGMLKSFSLHAQCNADVAATYKIKDMTSLSITATIS